MLKTLKITQQLSRLQIKNEWMKSYKILCSQMAQNFYNCLFQLDKDSYSEMVAQSLINKHENMQLSLNLRKVWQLLKEYSPSILKSPLALLNLTLQITNSLIIVLLFSVLLGQTVYILNGSERRYINLRHLLIKWTTLVVITMFAGYAKRHTNFDEMFEFMCNMLALAMVYPSKFIKNLHLKYFAFSQRKKNEQNNEEASQLEMTFITRILSSFTIFFLNTCRYIITFIAPQHRKKIEEAMRGVNLVIVEQKYFWKMYEANARGSIVIPQSSNQIPSLFQSAGSLAKSGHMKKNSDLVKQIPKSPKSSIRSNSLRAKVVQYIQLSASNLNSVSQKRYSQYRKIQIVYSCYSSQLTVIDENSGQSTVHELVQFSPENNLFLKFGFDNEDQPLLVKFRNKKEYHLFYNTLYLQAQHQSTK